MKCDELSKYLVWLLEQNTRISNVIFVLYEDCNSCFIYLLTKCYVILENSRTYS